jgi:D-glycero-D-manno-heptose 1,7-bisphosphate phosphatase
MQKAVFLDRDGTIIEDVGYLSDISQIRILPGATEAIRLLNNIGFKVIIVTNQAGVARGYFTESRANEINEKLRQLLADHGSIVDRIYYCPHHIEGIVEKYKIECNCRKPNPGMIEQAVKELDIDISNSFMIGDKSSDIEAGRRAGCKTIYIGGNINPRELEKLPQSADHIATNLLEAVKWLLHLNGRMT